jgi:DNA polymerase
MTSHLYKDILEIYTAELGTNNICEIFCRDNHELGFLNDFSDRKIFQPPEKDSVAVKLPQDGVEVDENSSIDQLIASCNKCSEVSERKGPFGSGINQVMIIMNAPMMITRVEKKLYKNESVEMLTKIVNSIKLKTEECYITNLIKCDTESLINKPSNMFLNCQNILQKEIKELDPKIILVMGELLPLQKLYREFSNISWFNIEHPITLIKNPDLKRSAWSTLQNVTKFYAELNH